MTPVHLPPIRTMVAIYKHTATTVLYEGWTTPVHLPPIRTTVATNTQLQLYCMKAGRLQSIYLLHGSYMYKHTTTTALYEAYPIRTTLQGTLNDKR